VLPGGFFVRLRRIDFSPTHELPMVQLAVTDFFQMGESRSPLNFRWTSRFSALKPPAASPPKSAHEDGGLTAWCSEAAKSLSLSELARKVRVSWNPRMQTTAGRAWWPDRAIELNPKLRECAPEELWRTLKHELAHLVAYERSSRRRIEPHGSEWQQACADLGIPGELPYHNLPFKRRRMKRNHAYICTHCFAEVHRVRPFPRAVACYDCCRKFNNGCYHDRFRLLKCKP
jgi:SprT protein